MSKIRFFRDSKEVALDNIPEFKGYKSSYIMKEVRLYVREKEEVNKKLGAIFAKLTIVTKDKTMFPNPFYTIPKRKRPHNAKATLTDRVQAVITQIRAKYPRQAFLTTQEAMHELGLTGREINRVYLTDKLPNFSINAVANFYVRHIEFGDVK